MPADSTSTVSLFNVVCDLQEQMEAQGLSAELVDAIVMRGIEIILGAAQENDELALV